MTRQVIGNRVREVCELLERHPSCLSDELPLMSGIAYRSWQTKYLHRAVHYGLVDAVMGEGGWCYSVVPNWREEARLHEERERAPKPRRVLPVLPTLTEWRHSHPWGALGAAQRACL